MQNRKYIGEYQYRDVVIPNGVPSIVSKELFALAMDRLEKNKYAPSTYKADIRYLLSTKLMCGSCGSTMVGESGTGRNDKKYHYYKCSNAKKKKGCKQHTIRKDDIEKAVIQKTVSYVFDSEVIGGIVDRALQWQEKENTTLPLLQSQVSDVKKALNNVMTATPPRAERTSLQHRKPTLRPTFPRGIRGHSSRLKGRYSFFDIG